jgi:hypothetical protein
MVRISDLSQTSRDFRNGPIAYKLGLGLIVRYCQIAEAMSRPIKGRLAHPKIHKCYVLGGV